MEENKILVRWHRSFAEEMVTSCSGCARSTAKFRQMGGLTRTINLRMRNTVTLPLDLISASTDLDHFEFQSFGANIASLNVTIKHYASFRICSYVSAVTI
jgi:hypothetical protein